MNRAGLNMTNFPNISSDAGVDAILHACHVLTEDVVPGGYNLTACARA